MLLSLPDLVDLDSLDDLDSLLGLPVLFLFLYPVMLEVVVVLDLVVALSGLLPVRALVLPPALLGGARLLLGLDPGHDCRAAVVAVEEIVDLLGQVLPGQLAVLRARASVLALDDDAGRDVFELNGGIGLVLLNGGNKTKGAGEAPEGRDG